MNKQNLIPKQKIKYSNETTFNLEVTNEMDERNVNPNAIRVMNISESYLGETMESFS